MTLPKMRFLITKMIQKIGNEFFQRKKVILRRKWGVFWEKGMEGRKNKNC